ncbi:MAG: hypothetical protein IT303_09460 [Dehalococcoidia bacterium]|nr:hypothetical protein [Dehalococcoidia bacterium]
MRSLFMLALGLVSGAVATVLFFTLDPGFEAGNPNDVGGGNARVSFDEDALSALATRELRGTSGFADDAIVAADIREDGLVTFDITLGALVVGVKASITIDPEIRDGQLALVVVDASLGELGVPGDVAHLLEGPLQSRLDALAGELDYRLTSIATADDRLTLEIEV